MKGECEIVMKVTLKNSKMMEMVHQIEPLLSHCDKIGYIAARNYRLLTDCLTEYLMFRNSLIEKYGEPEIDQNGNKTPLVSITPNSPNFRQFCDELAPFNEMTHEVELMTAKYDDVIGCLSGKEILAIDWMLED